MVYNEDMIIQEVNPFELFAALSWSVDGLNWRGLPHTDLGDVMVGKIADWFDDVFEDDSAIYVNRDAQAILNEGINVQPILIMVNGVDCGGLVADASEGWGVGNGNHRLALALAAGFETILVAFTDQPEDYMHEYLTGI